MALASCVTTSMSVVTLKDSCTKIFKPISWSHSDTPKTVIEIKKHNAVWEDLNAKAAN